MERMATSTVNNNEYTETRQTLLCLVTFGLSSPSATKMSIRQVHYASGLSDCEKDISYLENLQSICYPDGLQSSPLTIKLPPPKQGGSPSFKTKESLDNSEAINQMKNHQITHYSITTQLYVKRYLSILLCQEPY
jgi:hypothetical protein